jgi:hypothetical protein
MRFSTYSDVTRDATGRPRLLCPGAIIIPWLAPPILLAVGLNVAAVRGLADIAGFHAVFTSLIRIQWP